MFHDGYSHHKNIWLDYIDVVYIYISKKSEEKIKMDTGRSPISDSMGKKGIILTITDEIVIYVLYSQCSIEALKSSKLLIISIKQKQNILYV